MTYGFVRLIGICWWDSCAHVVSLVLFYMTNTITKHLVSDVLVKIEVKSLERPGPIVLVLRARERVGILVCFSLIADSFRLKLKVIWLARYLIWDIRIDDAELLVVILLFFLARQSIIIQLTLDGVQNCTVVLGNILAIIIPWTCIRKVRPSKTIAIISAVSIVSPVQRFVVTKAWVWSSIPICILVVDLLHPLSFKMIG